MDRVSKRAASPTLSDSSKKSPLVFSTAHANMTSTCELTGDENVLSSADFPAVPVPAGRIDIPHLPATEPTHDVLKDVTSEHGLADLVFEPMQPAMSDGADRINGDSALGLTLLPSKPLMRSFRGEGTQVFADGSVVRETRFLFPG